MVLPDTQFYSQLHPDTYVGQPQWIKDRAAADGIRYKYAYSNAAVCAVARNTLILGRYACSTGNHNMRSRYPVPEHFRTYPSLDKQIGDWLKELDDEGARDNTIVFYHSDHGGIPPRAKRYINDTGTHVPLIARFPKKWQHLAPAEAGTVSDRPVAFIDLPPTVFSLAGVEIPGQFQGHAFAGKAAVEKEPYVFLFGQRFDSRMLRFVRAVTDGEYRYIRNFHPHRHRGILAGYPHGQVSWQSLLKLKQAGKLNDVQSAYWTIPQPVEELYHTAQDPWELNNLVNAPKHQDRLARMRDAALNKMREIGDTGLVPEAMYEGILSLSKRSMSRRPSAS